MIGKTIEDEERYLIKISDVNASDISHFLNMTEEPMQEVLLWRYRIQMAVSDSPRGFKMKLLNFIRKWVSQSFAFLFVKIWMAYNNSKSFKNTIKLLLDKQKPSIHTKTQTLRKTVSELCSDQEPISKYSTRALRKSH